MNLFINFSNHLSCNWSCDQLQAARKYGDIVDINFPSVDPCATNEQIQREALRYARQIIDCSPKAVLCQGEFTLAFTIANLLKLHGVLVLAACTERVSVESTENNVTQKISKFKFTSFREY